MRSHRGAALARTGWAVGLALLSLLAAAPDAAGAAGTGGAAGTSGAVGVYRVPVAGPAVVVRAFTTGVSRYGPGHRGVDLRASQHGSVYAAGGGTVTFAGQVAGRGVVVLRHDDGLTTEYEPVSPAVRAGMRVAKGTEIGRLNGTHLGCADSCLHWGARRGVTYLDPMSLLDPLGPVRLLPDT